MGLHSEAGLNRKFLEFIKLLNIYLNHFPKHEKVNDLLENTVYINLGRWLRRANKNQSFLCWDMQKEQILYHIC